MKLFKEQTIISMVKKPKPDASDCPAGGKRWKESVLFMRDFLGRSGQTTRSITGVAVGWIQPGHINDRGGFLFVPNLYNFRFGKIDVFFITPIKLSSGDGVKCHTRNISPYHLPLNTQSVVAQNFAFEDQWTCWTLLWRIYHSGRRDRQSNPQLSEGFLEKYPGK